MLIDTHAHLYDDQFDEDLETVIERARNAGVEVVVLPAVDAASTRAALELCARYEGLYAMAALHPSETKEAADSDFDEVAALCAEEKVVAVGESGLDYYWDRSFDERQQAMLRRHVRLAIEADLPLILHNREATEDLIQILREEKASAGDPDKLRGIFHCFVDSPEVAEQVAELGFLVGLGGILTFKNSDVDRYALTIPLEQIVLETDAPYLAPEPHRGKRNEPAYVRHVAEKLAEVKERPVEEIAEETTENARRLFEIN